MTRSTDMFGRPFEVGQWVAYPQNYGLHPSILFCRVEGLTSDHKKPKVVSYFEGNGEWFGSGRNPSVVHSTERLWILHEGGLPPDLVKSNCYIQTVATEKGQ